MRRTLLFLLLPSALLGQTPEELFTQRKLPDAKAAFETRLKSNPGDASAMYYLGRIADMENRNDHAIEWFERAVKRDPNSALYHYWLGSAVGEEAQQASKLRQPFLARKVKAEFERAVQLDPVMVEPRMGLVDFYSIAPGFMGGSMEKARAQAAELVKLHPMRGHLAYARIAMREKLDSAVVASHEAAIAAAPDSTAGYYGLGSYYRSKSRFADALRVYDRLLVRRNDEVLAHALFGIVSAIGGLEMERGERELKYFLANAPKESTTAQSWSNVHYRLGMLYDKTGRADLAQREYAEAVRWNPKNEDAKRAMKGRE
jgi:tetratricopeptide (TPR) repeat protein